VLAVVDGVFSMEGDIAPLPEIVELCEHHAARLLVDEAHAVGVLGEHGTGTSELFGLADRISVIHWGQVIAEGTPEGLRQNPWIRASQIGEAV